MEKILQDIEKELERANKQYPMFNSFHEGLSVIQEEVFELQQWVYKRHSQQDRYEMRAEAIQIAAMAIKFIQSMEGK